MIIKYNDDECLDVHYINKNINFDKKEIFL